MPTKPDISKKEGLVRTYELFEELQADVTRAYKVLEERRDSQFLRRTTVRAIFALIEASAEIIKSEIRSTLRLEGGKDRLSQKELGVLGGLSITPGPRDQKFLPLEDNLKLTFKLAAKTWGLAEFQLDAGGESYRDFLQAKDARNRLTHPRTYYDIQVTDEDMHCHTVAFYWLCREFNRLFQHRVKFLAEQIPEEDREAFLKGHGGGLKSCDWR
ncbi:hypothetical protein [Alcanivorax sp. 24]|uniref:hypothetical protein n=1 Tax=Alcanivorax sp. 24 TaxID=2545266 RepID=UPI00105E793E|nr:hypothetical protein [Alcanivorax sp. 24]